MFVMHFNLLFILVFVFIYRVAAVNDSSIGVSFDSTTLKQNNLVDVQTLDSTILVHLAYSTADNFIGENVYGSLKSCYLRREAAEMLVKAQQLLSKRHSGYRLLVYDGLRPRHIQQVMWDVVKGTPKAKYVASPNPGSIHNHGAAVDLTIADSSGQPLDMGTPFDYMDVKAQPRYESYFADSGLIEKANLDVSIKKQIRDDIVKLGPLTTKSLENRKLLRKVMVEAGFLTIPNEWWHFNAFDKTEVRKRFPIVE
jgi:D-alanyl-D-alanine dipeptidase